MKKITCVDAYGNEHTFKEDEYIDRISVYGVHIKNDTVLLVLDKWSGNWGLAGGGVDSGETLYEGLKREFIEETGLLIGEKTKELLNDVNYFLADGEEKPWKSFRKVFLVDIVGGNIKASGNEDDTLQTKYIPIKQAVEFLKKSKTNKPIAEIIKALNGKN